MPKRATKPRASSKKSKKTSKPRTKAKPKDEPLALEPVAAPEPSVVEPTPPPQALPKPTPQPLLAPVPASVPALGPEPVAPPPQEPVIELGPKPVPEPAPAVEPAAEILPEAVEEMSEEPEAAPEQLPPRREVPPNHIFIGKKPVMGYALSAVMQLTQYQEVVLRARGKAISRAVDVAEVIINRLGHGQFGTLYINIDTDIVGEGAEKRNVSTIEISVGRKAQP
jgi:DNA-binding protein